MIIKLIKVSGESMIPHLDNGDYVIVSSWGMNISIGNVVVVEHPVYHRIIKRVVQVFPNGELWLSGENKRSLSSEQLGRVQPETIIGKVVMRIKKHKH